MAMDKEMLLQRLQGQYLTRQEVLYKLPLNISITSFWPELLERRKQSSTLLPLHGADGKPLWYVLTDKMIAASEKLCAAALERTDTIDPYKPTLTGAMTEELFFTSFVEGAQIDLKMAMEFLERGDEPENVQEQLIHNNRAAWSAMLHNLFYPLDNHFVGMLAYQLTDEMDGHATAYRQTDDHPIAVMRNEAFQVPAAAALPTLMDEFYAFMANTEVHPLIKAAVGQAFLLITRPYPDGNERLARMISYVILLRSGYDFFRDISISSLIAKESFRYYKSMQDIIRSENGGDLTYFVEYYLDLLARSIDAKAEQDRRRQQEALRKEREAAAQPLSRPVPSTPCPSQVSGPEQTVSNEVSPAAADVEEVPMEEASGTDKPPGNLYTLEEYIKFLHKARRNRSNHIHSERIERIFSQLEHFARHGPHRFTRHDWEQMTGTLVSKSKGDVALMVKMQLVARDTYVGKTETRSYCIPLHPGEQRTVMCPELVPPAVVSGISKFTESEHIKERQMAHGLLDMISSGKISFTYAEWLARNPAPNKDVAFGILRIALNYGFITLEDGFYTIAKVLPKGPQCSKLPDKQRDVLLHLMDAYPAAEFTIKAAAISLNIKPSTLAYHLDNFVQRGLLQVDKAPGNLNMYKLSPDIHAIFDTIGESEHGRCFQQHAAASADDQTIDSLIAAS